jgi:hypothetical protein
MHRAGLTALGWTASKQIRYRAASELNCRPDELISAGVELLCARAFDND